MPTLIFFSLFLPLQANSATCGPYAGPALEIVRATIDSARIIGLPRMKTMDSMMKEPKQINELIVTTPQKANSRKEFLQSYFGNKNRY
jgi:hypothetical protein